jgi:hypothetical protein
MRWLALLAAATAVAPTQQTIPKLILKPAQVGPNYLLVARADSIGVNARTLDLCGVRGYASEKLRVARVQVDYRKPSTPLTLSNEVVAYQSDGAEQAMREVAARVSTCPKRPVDTGTPGLPKLRFTLRVLQEPGLLPGAIVVKVRVLGAYKGKHVDQTSYAIYQRLGSVLSGVYSSGPNTKEQLRFCVHAARQSARTLRRVLHPGLSA